MDSKSLGILAGIGAAALISYCFYFDHKRRTSPDFKAKLLEEERIRDMEQFDY